MNQELLTFYMNASKRFVGRSEYSTQEILDILRYEYEQMVGLGKQQLNEQQL